jgi:release factor glutamine methyltransferase
LILYPASAGFFYDISMTIREIQNRALDLLPRTFEYSLAVEVLLAHALRGSREELFSHADREVSFEDERLFGELLSKHLDGEPVAYLTGVKEFYGLNFFVDRRVIIPRPETEHLVDEVISCVQRHNKSLSILDVGTGSGCIALTLAHKLQNVQVTAVDISFDALEVARKNAVQLGVDSRVVLRQSDLLLGVEGAFDIVVANLPYIGKEKFHFVSREALDFEPHVALFGGSDGLRLYGQFFQQLSTRPWRPRLLVGEFGFLQAEAMGVLLERFFPQRWEIKKDYASIDRMFVVGFPPDIPTKV